MTKSIENRPASGGIATADITAVGVMAALIFAGTYCFKIPVLFGYTHLGDCLLVLGVALLGTKRGAAAAAIGAGLSDLLGGYMMWVVPTMVIKGLWGLVMGLIVYGICKGRGFALPLGAALGGVVQIVLYTLVKVPLYGAAYAISEIPVLTGQTVVGIVIGILLFRALKATGALSRLSRFNGQ